METNSVVTLKIQKASDLAIIPEYQTPGSSGMDVCSIENHTLYPGERTLIQTGLRLEIPEGYEVQVRPRSGLALKHGITVLNTPGTVDSSYRGLLGIILINQGKDKFEIEKGFRIAQIVLCPVAHAKIEVVSEVSETVRGEGGFGSTGIK